MSSAQLSQLPVKVLKQMLEANSAATYGTREQLVERLESGQQGKKKPGPKVKPDTVVNKPNVKDEIDFYKKERPRLIAQGMKDKKKQDEELKRRWQNKIGLSSPKAKVTSATAKSAATNETVLKMQLTKPQEKDLGFSLVRIDTDASGTPSFVYAKAGAKAGKAPNVSVPFVKTRGIKRAREEDDDTEQVGESEAEWWEEFIAGRMKKKLKRSTMLAIMKDMDPEEKTSGTTVAELSELAAYQFINETDDEAEDDDDDDEIEEEDDEEDEDE